MILISTETPNIGYIDTRIGGRKENQDNAGFVDTPFGLLVLVCDGMGGGPGGKTASATVVDVVMDVVSKGDPDEVSCEEIFKTAISKSNEVLRKIAEDNPSLRGMGTTIAAIIINEDQAVIAHVGDSRVYKIRGNVSSIPFAEKVFRTQDHSMVGELVRRGTLTEEQARLSSESNKITRAIGTQESVITDIDIVPYERGDRFLICSDGIWGAMPEKELIKNACLKKTVSTVVEKIANLADNYGLKEGGHHDNLTIAIIETKNDSNLKEKMNRKARQIIAGMAVCILLCLMLVFNLLSNNNKQSHISEELILAKSNLVDVETKLKKQIIKNDSLNKIIKKVNQEKIDNKKNIKESNSKVNSLSIHDTISTNNEDTEIVKDEKDIKEDNIQPKSTTKTYETIRDEINALCEKLKNSEYDDLQTCKTELKGFRDRIIRLLTDNKNNPKIQRTNINKLEKLKKKLEKYNPDTQVGEYNKKYRLNDTAKKELDNIIRDCKL